MPLARKIDKMGRLNLGREYAGKAVMVKKVDSGKFILTFGRFISERESWLYENPTALAMVRRGLKESAEGAAAAPPPDLEADAAEFSDEETK